MHLRLNNDEPRCYSSVTCFASEGSPQPASLGGHRMIGTMRSVMMTERRPSTSAHTGLAVIDGPPEGAVNHWLGASPGNNAGRQDIATVQK